MQRKTNFDGFLKKMMADVELVVVQSVFFFFNFKWDHIFSITERNYFPFNAISNRKYEMIQINRVIGIHREPIHEYLECDFK